MTDAIIDNVQIKFTKPKVAKRSKRFLTPRNSYSMPTLCAIRAATAMLRKTQVNAAGDSVKDPQRKGEIQMVGKTSEGKQMFGWLIIRRFG